MELNNNDGRAKIIAYYLPQFFPNKFNDQWYGKGFTEWTNVGKAKPLFRGHYQPKVPADLGYYDLRVPEVVEQQAQLALEAGISGFAYWHYWWAGDKLLNEPAERMLYSKKPDFPFCFAWANENWYKKMWNKDKKDDKLVMEQTYPGEVDNKEHFNYCLPFFRDKRYITFSGRPVFVIYRPLDFPDVSLFINQWNNLIRKEGIADRFYFIGFQYKSNDINKLKEIGFDCITPQHSLRISETYKTKFGHVCSFLKYKLGKQCATLRHVNYEKYPMTVWNKDVDSRDDVAPQIIPNWDNTPRAGRRGLVYDNATPENFEKVAECVIKEVQKKQNKILFLKSWNEWAEGNYMEPDMKYGHKFLTSLRSAIDKF